jgi:hypothetical protein
MKMNAGEHVCVYWGGRKPIHCCWECELIQRLLKSLWSFHKKLKIELSYDPWNCWAYIQRNVCHHTLELLMFIAVLFTAAELQNYPKCISKNE